MVIKAIVCSSDMPESSMFMMRMNMNSLYVNGSRIIIDEFIKSSRSPIHDGRSRYTDIETSFHIDTPSAEIPSGYNVNDMYAHIRRMYDNRQTVASADASDVDEPNHDPDSETYHDNMPGMTISEFQKWTDELIAEFGNEIDTTDDDTG
jgi:hypothetical protein